MQKGRDLAQTYPALEIDCNRSTYKLLSYTSWLELFLSKQLYVKILPVLFQLLIIVRSPLCVDVHSLWEQFRAKKRCSKHLSLVAVLREVKNLGRLGQASDCIDVLA